MHPLILQQLAADRINDMIAKADNRRQAREARRARQSRPSRQRTRHSLPRTQAEPPRTAATTAVAAIPAPGRSCLPAGGGQGSELALAERGHTRAR
ncbi:MAG: hypothetical protein ACLPXZ_02475 [Mycobacterium sp.]